MLVSSIANGSWFCVRRWLVLLKIAARSVEGAACFVGDAS